jgi:V/A-type H+-transporting ATPase subunit E
MGSVEGNIQALSQSILGEARAEIEDIKLGAKSRADSIRQQAQEAIARERAEILARANDEAKRLRSQAVATAQMKARALELEHRETLLQQVFAEAAKRLQQAPRRADYGATALELAKEALSQLRSKAGELRMDEATQRVLTKSALDTLSTATGVTVSVGKPLEKGIGVIARTPDGRLQFDNTLESRLERLKSLTRSMAYRVLMGEEG